MATKQKWTNLASSTLAAPITNADTVLDIQSGAGSKFPSTSDGFFTIRITDGSGNYEFIDVITRSTDTFDDLVRETDEASRFPARSWNAGASVTLIGTSKKTLERFSQKDDDEVITGNWEFQSPVIFSGGASIVIPGMVMMWPVDSTPSGYLLCDGSAVNRTTYSALFDVIGTFYGAGDGVDTFNVPNYGGRSPMASGPGALTHDVAAADVNTTDDTLLVDSNTTTWLTGMQVQLTTTDTLPTGLALLTTYYVLRDSTTTIRLGTTLANAVSGATVNISSQGVGVHTITHLLTTRAVAEFIGEETHVQTPDQLALHGHAYQASYTNQTSFHSFPTGGMATSTSSAGTQSAFKGTPSNAQGQQIGGSGGGEAFNVIGPTFVLRFIIKT